MSQCKVIMFILEKKLENIYCKGIMINIISFSILTKIIYMLYCNHNVITLQQN